MTLLKINGLNTYYGESHILRNVDININSGEMVCLIGRNGVGKTTFLKSIIGLLTPRSGEITFNGDLINRKPPHQRARSGIAYVPQGREIIPYLSVEENLQLGARCSFLSSPFKCQSEQNVFYNYKTLGLKIPTYLLRGNGSRRDSIF